MVFNNMIPFKRLINNYLNKNKQKFLLELF